MALSGSELPNNTQQAAKRLESDIATFSPVTSFEYVTVTFPTANLDTVVTTKLRPANPENIYYEVVDWKIFTPPAAAPYVYRDTTSTRKPWGNGFIVLRCNYAVTAVIRLSTPRTF